MSKFVKKEIIGYAVIAVATGLVFEQSFVQLIDGQLLVLAISGILASFLIKEKRLIAFTKRAGIAGVLFSLIFAAVIEIVTSIHGSPVEFGGTFIAAFVICLPVHLLGLYLGMILHGIFERIPRKIKA